MKRVGLAVLCLMLSSAVFAEQEEVTTFVATVEDGVQRVEVLGGDYYFKPNHIVVKKDVPVELTVKKAPGMIPHDIVMNAPEAGMVFKVGFGTDGEVIRFTPTKTGTYPFYCDKRFLFFKSHKERGMHGEIEVVE